MPERPSTSGRRPAPPPLRSIAGLRLLRRLGQGGMSTVYLAYDEARGQMVAVKVLAEALAHDSIQVRRFEREARLGKQLRHPHLVPVLASGRDGPHHYLLMDFVDGLSAQAVLDQGGAVPAVGAVRWIIDIVRALEYLHARRLVHRDIKPGNILVPANGPARLVDLGLAKELSSTETQLTAIEQGFGTPHYMPYEQALNARLVDARSDLYSVGATLYHLVTGHVPFEGASSQQVLERVQQGQVTPPSVRNPQVPACLDPILLKLLAVDPRLRYSSAAALLADLLATGLTGAPADTTPDLSLRLLGTGTANDSTPTQANLPAPPKPAATDKQWRVRLPAKAGGWRILRATTAQVEQLRHAQRLTDATLIARGHGPFVPWRSWPEFQPKPASAPQRSLWSCWFGLTLGVGVVVGAVCWLFCHV